MRLELAQSEVNQPRRGEQSGENHKENIERERGGEHRVSRALGRYHGQNLAAGIARLKRPSGGVADVRCYYWYQRRQKRHNAPF
ncbi:MAG: hypothetical protein LBH36_00525 [Candidatus Nomurabacteria bacterium]|nr:hypothetical protein [Candidatus Nomurabacteria bacterium]